MLASMRMTPQRASRRDPHLNKQREQQYGGDDEDAPASCVGVARLIRPAVHFDPDQCDQRDGRSATGATDRRSFRLWAQEVVEAQRHQRNLGERDKHMPEWIGPRPSIPPVTGDKSRFNGERHANSPDDPHYQTQQSTLAAK